MTSLLSYVTVNDLPVLDPLSLSRQASARGESDSQWVELANSVVIPRGKDPTTAYLLLSYDSVEAVSNAVSTIRLVVEPERPSPLGEDKDAASSNFPGIDDIKITDMYLHATTGVLAPWDEKESPYLAEFRGPRQIASMSAIDKAYNCYTPYFADREEPSAPTADYWAVTLKPDESQWTWREMLDDIWGMIPILGDPPDYGKSNLPAENPVNYRFHGWSAWDAFNKALLDTGNYVVPNVFRETAGDNPWMVVAESTEGAEQESLTEAKQVPTDLSHPRKLVATRIPEKVKVLFPSRTYDYEFDADENVVHPKDSFSSKPTHVETISNPSPAGTIAGTEVILSDSLPAYYDITTGNILNQSKLNDRATELATEYFKVSSDADVRDTFSGLHRITPDYGIADTTLYDFGLGWQTRITHDFHRSQMDSDPKSSHYYPDEAKDDIPYHRCCYVLITEAIPGGPGATINPGGIGKGSVRWWNPNAVPPAWWPVVPAKEVYFYNAGLAPIDLSVGASYAYLEFWWQTRAFITFCAFQAT